MQTYSWLVHSFASSSNIRATVNFSAFDYRVVIDCRRCIIDNPQPHLTLLVHCDACQKTDAFADGRFADTEHNRALWRHWLTRSECARSERRREFPFVDVSLNPQLTGYACRADCVQKCMSSPSNEQKVTQTRVSKLIQKAFVWFIECL